MSYATQAQLEARYGTRMLIDLTDRGDVATGVVDAQVVAAALTAADLALWDVIGACRRRGGKRAAHLAGGHRVHTAALRRAPTLARVSVLPDTPAGALHQRCGARLPRVLGAQVRVAA